MDKKFLASYEEWEKTVPEEIKQEAVWEFYAYRKALFVFDLCWHDCEKLLNDPRGRIIADQLIVLYCTEKNEKSKSTITQVLGKLVFTSYVL